MLDLEPLVAGMHCDFQIGLTQRLVLVWQRIGSLGNLWSLSTL